MGNVIYFPGMHRDELKSYFARAARRLDEMAKLDAPSIVFENELCNLVSLGQHLYGQQFFYQSLGAKPSPSGDPFKMVE